MDVVSPADRSRMMRRIRTQDTRPELIVRRILHRLGYRFRLHRKDLPGKPDIVLPRLRKIVFIHGCFWHGHPACRAATRPTSNVEFWNDKLDANRERDRDQILRLEQLGWLVLVIWECETKTAEVVSSRLQDFLKKGS